MLPPVPIPDLDATLTEVSRVLSHILSPTEFQAYEDAVANLIMPPSAPLRAILDSTTTTSQIYSASAFRSFLLSRRDPLFHCLTIPVALRTPPGTQILVAARLLSRLAVIVATPDEHLSISTTGLPLDPEETSLFLGTTRRVGLAADILVSTPSSRHVVVWCNGRAFALDICDPSLLPYSEEAIAVALREICEHAARHCSVSVSVASLSWNLSRTAWFHTREALEAQSNPVNKEYFVSVDTALATVALEPFDLSLDPAEQLVAVRIGRGSVNRYADQVVGFVVYANGLAGMSVDHAPVDGGIVIQLANKLATLAAPRTQSNDLIHPTFLDISLPSHFEPFSFPSPALQSAVRVIELNHPEKIPAKLSHHAHKSRLVPFMVHMAVQAALHKIPALQASLVVQPTSMRHFVKGRSQPSYPVTAESIALITALEKTQDPIGKEHLRTLFHAAYVAHKAVIKFVKRGTGVGRHLISLVNALNDVKHSFDAKAIQLILQAWGRFSGIGCLIVYITGFDEAPGVHNSIGNLYTNNQLACWYSAHTELEEIPHISLAVTGTGVFAEERMLDNIVDYISDAFAMLAHLIPGRGDETPQGGNHAGFDDRGPQ
ncbi:Carnitine O-palmitoyltransferase 1, brain isoform [Hypsizygus marmoreus]|uniref:Carnitine O-palmitoyltransferase 1, brain isoform n=1 Tax=Hypsizygus marmoreus TaxID=39966 RepID=A0A369JYG5_HYPMA|nr:Carnitine O-palmitoyltransferase 1, brain isoform [Hypsizygus marmoreus]